MRVLFAAFFVLALCGLATQASAQGNGPTTIVLHATDSSFAGCTDTGGLDCLEGGVLPTVDATGFANIAIFMLLRNYEDVAGVQCAFQTTWPMMFGLWDCQSGQVNGTVPAAPFGADSGTIATAFNAITGGTLSTIGRMFFAGGGASSGCIEIIESSFPFETHVVDSSQVVTPIIVANRGIVCVGAGGYNACEGEVPVEPATWGNIKAQYNK